MAKKKKNSSCLGLFVKAFILTVLVLLILSGLSIMAAIQFFQADPHVWTDFSVWNSYPWFVVYGTFGLAAVLSFFIALAGAAVSAIFASDGKKGRSAPKKAARPQSNRKTTL